MPDIYDIIDNIHDKNDYPDNQPDGKQRPSNPEGDAVPETVDFFQQHPFRDQFNDPTGVLSVYDPLNPDRQFFDIVESEVIELSSPPIKYYKLRHLENNIDPVYGEAQRRDVFNDPVTVHGNYENPSMDQELTSFGLKEIEELEIQFNYNYILSILGDKLQIGDIIQTYDAKIWEVMTSLIIDESLWRAQHNLVRAKRRIEGIYLPDKGKIEQSPNVPTIE